MFFRASSLLVWALCALSMVSAQSAYPITGIKVGSTSAVPIRRNINDMYAGNGPQWHLYIRSLVEMYKEDPKNQLSFFQIAGIHGKPYVEWNGAGGRTSNGWRGYCPHGENLFLPWHRPYIMLFEQRLHETANRLAKQYPANVREKWVSAAKTLRSPYWDWASSQSVPPATVPTKLRISVPKGQSLQTVEIDNPLRYYKFPKAALDGAFGTFDQPQNRPQIYKCRAPQNYPNSANQAMSQRSYRRWVYDALTRSTTFDQFASTSSSGVSLEQIHNAVHWDGSCGQQFLDADFSAFDPLFMLHHTNVDRLWAYWQFMRPNQASFTSSYRGGARWATRDGTTITPDSPLQPFYASAGKFHTPKSVSSIKGKGYTYEGLEYWKKTSAQMQRDATALINRLYATGVARPQIRKRDDEEEKTRYFAQVKVDVEELERPASINVYVGDEMVGNLVVLKQPQTGSVFGKFGLDSAPAADPVETADQDTDVVVDDILSTIRVEILKPDGSNIPIDTVPSLKIELENVHVLPPETNTELPEYKDAEKRPAPKEEVDPEVSVAHRM